MKQFDERKNAFENKFARDEAMQFKAQARANKMLAVWVAERLGLDESEVDDYVLQVIRSDFVEVGTEDVFRKIAADLGDRASEAEIRERMAACLDQAKAQLAG